MQETHQEIPTDPRHVAIVMDGNGRWAERRGLPRHEGHMAGVENVRPILEAARELGIQYLTLFAFSSENWSRPSEEVNLLMSLLQDFIEEQGEELVRHEIRFHVVGDPQKLPGHVKDALRHLTERTAHFRRHTLSLALNYGSRQEIAHAVRSYLRAHADQPLDPDNLSYDDLAAHFHTAGLPDPDLVIRTSGEFRLSNFLLLQSAYSEFFFSDKFWPEFSGEDLRAAVADYRRRERRFGKTGAQIQNPLASPLSAS